MKTVTAIATLAALTWVVISLWLAEAATLQGMTRFLGPPAGKKYVYQLSDGGRLEVVGLKSDASNAVEVEERAYPPSQTPMTGNGVVKTTYILMVINDVLVQQRGRSAAVLLQEPLTPGSREWERLGDTYADKTASKKHWRCTIRDKTEKQLHGALRTVVTVRCKMTFGDFSLFLDEQYADGIGKTEQSMETRTAAGELVGVQRVRLQRIERAGTDLK